MFPVFHFAYMRYNNTMLHIRRLVVIAGIFLSSVPAFAFAAGITTIVPQSPAGQEACPLGYQAILMVVQNITNDAVYLAGIFAVLLIAYAGFLFATNATSPSNLEKGRTVLMSTVIGFVIVISAWLIVNEVIVVFTTGNLQSVTSLLESHSSSQCLSKSTPGAGEATIKAVHKKAPSKKTAIKVVSKKTTTKKTPTAKIFDPEKEANAFLSVEATTGFSKNPDSSARKVANQALMSEAITDLKAFCMAYSQKVPYFSSGGAIQGTCTQTEATQALNYLSLRFKPFLRTRITITPGETNAQILAAEHTYALNSIGLQAVLNAIVSRSISGGL